MIILPDIPIKITLDLVLKELKTDLKIRRADAARRWKEKIIELTERSREWLKPSGIYEIFDCEIKGEQLFLDEEKGVLTSATLAKTFVDGGRIGLFITTIGPKLEENIKKILIPDSIILDAIGSAAAEECAKHLHYKIIEPLIKDCDDQKTVRLSPGWGLHKRKQNWNLTEQKIIFDLLRPEKNGIGVTLTSDYLMLPRKSVSAIVGVKRIYCRRI